MAIQSAAETRDFESTELTLGLGLPSESELFNEAKIGALRVLVAGLGDDAESELMTVLRQLAVDGVEAVTNTLSVVAGVALGALTCRMPHGDPMSVRVAAANDLAALLRET